MSNAVICTVGTSLLTNARDDRPWAGWRHGQDQPLPPAEQVEDWLASADPAAASAETNTLRALDLSPNDAIWFLYSETPPGRFCSARLAAHYGRLGHPVKEYPIAHLGYSANAFSTGLKGLVHQAISCAKAARDAGLQPLFCATGGFKAEIAYINLLGALLGIEVVYLHELHRDLVRLPPLPLEWNAEFVEKHQAFFEWIDDEPRTTAEVESRLKAAPDLRPLVEHSEDGYTYLNAAGDLLYQAAKARLSGPEPPSWPEDSPLPPDKKIHLSNVAHHRPGGWEAFVNRLARLPFVTSIRFDGECKGLQPAVRILDAEKGTFGIRYGDGPPPENLGLRVETTAKGQAQCELVLGYLRKYR